MSALSSTASDWSDKACPAPDTFFHGFANIGQSPDELRAIFTTSMAIDFSQTAQQDAVQSYVGSMLGILIPPVAVGLLTFFCLLPCYISRCCAHRCCRLRSLKRRTVCVRVIYVILFLAMVTLVTLAIMSTVDTSVASQEAACVAASSLDVADAKLLSVASNFSVLVNNTDALLDGFDLALGNIKCLQDSSIDWVCLEVQEAQDQLQYLDAELGPDQYDALSQSLDQAAMACATYEAFLDLLSQLESLIDELVTVFTQSRDLFDLSARFVTQASTEIDSVATSLYEGIALFWPHVSVQAVWLGLGLFFGPLFFGTLALLAWAMMQRGASHPTRCCTIKNVGVQLTGVAWVMASCEAWFYLMAGAVLVCIVAMIVDFADVVEPVPSQFTESFNNTVICGVMPQDPFEDGLGAADVTDESVFCAVANVILTACWSGENYLDALLIAAGSNWTFGGLIEALEEWGDEIIAEPALGDVTVDVLADGVLGANSSLSSFDPSQGWNMSALRVIGQSIDTAASGVIEPDGCFSDLVTATLTLIPASLLVLLKSMVAWYTFGYCTWVHDLWTAMITSIRSVTVGPIMLGALGFIGIGVWLLLFIPAAISMQIIYGGVGTQPGCPARCRTAICCGANAGPRTNTGKPINYGGYGAPGFEIAGEKHYV